MTIAEIINREVAAANAALGLTRKDGAVYLACSRVAKAVVDPNRTVAIIDEVLCNRIKFIGDGEQLYTGCPADLIQELADALLPPETAREGK